MRIKWDEPSERFYKAGVDQGVFYLKDSGEYPKGVVWNGISSVKDSTGGREITDLFSGDIRRDFTKTKPERGGTISCFTYPDEMDSCIGGEQVVPGLTVYDQNEESFGFCYRRFIGNAADGLKNDYEIHVIYNATISGFDEDAETVNTDMNVDPMEFEYQSYPEEMRGYDPVSHLVIRASKFGKKKMDAIEDILYGTKSTDPYLPLPNELLDLLMTEAFLEWTSAESVFEVDFEHYLSEANGNNMPTSNAESVFDPGGMTYISEVSGGNQPTATAESILDTISMTYISEANGE